MKRIIAAFLVLLSLPKTQAIMNETNQDRWNKPANGGPDKEVPGFLVNLGPTGARAELKSKSFVVKYIFKGSPASNVLKINDEIVGANGKAFSSHTFGGRAMDHGHDGPIMDMGLAIEDSEGDNGELELTVKRGGKNIKVTVRLERLGKFSDTFPFGCQKSKTLLDRAHKYLLKNNDGLLAQGRCVMILSMLSSDNSRIRSEGKDLVKEWNNVPGPDTWSWVLSFQAITLAEYYLSTKDRSVLKTLEKVVDMIRTAQYKGNNIQVWKPHGGADAKKMQEHQNKYLGGFGHAPFNRDGTGGDGNRLNNGYGPMQRPTYLAILAYQLAKKCGIELKHNGIEEAFEFVDYGTTVDGNTAYGGEFTLNNGPIDSDNWKKRRGYGNSHRSAMAYMLYQISPERKESKKMMRLHLKNVEESYKDMAHGHACSLLGLTWGWIGVLGSDDKQLKRKVSDYYKAWLNMARCHGSDSYIVLPGRDYADEAYYRGNVRNHTTACAAMFYSFSSPRLQLQGLAKASTAPPPRYARTTIPQRVALSRQQRKLAKGNEEKLNKTLHNTLAALQKKGGIPTKQIKISKFSDKVTLGPVTDEGVSFKNEKGQTSKAYKLEDLSSRDRARLADLAVDAAPKSTDIKGLAGIFNECAGRLSTADDYYSEAGDESRKKFEQLFEE